MCKWFADSFVLKLGALAILFCFVLFCSLCAKLGALAVQQMALQLFHWNKVRSPSFK